jgi:hypothetical protein
MMGKEITFGDWLVQSIHWIHGHKVLPEAGERTRFARCRWRPRHRDLFLQLTMQLLRFLARLRKEPPRRVCSPA